jgi:NitT/TauT family transport system permease protein
MLTDKRESRQELSDELAGLDALELAGPKRQARGRRIWSATWPKLAAIGIVLGIWQTLSWVGWKEPYAFAPPRDAFAKLWEFAEEGILWDAVSLTMRRAAVGFLLSVVIGVILGSLVSRVRFLRAAFGSLITGIQTMPSVAWVPFSLLIFGLDLEKAILLVMVLGAAPSIANGLISGADHIPPVLLRAGRVLGARGVSEYRHVILPAAMPSFVGGLKQGWAFLWRSLMAAELVAQVPGAMGVGRLLEQSRELAQSDSVIAMMIVILVIGIVVDAAVFSQMDKAIRRRWGLIDNATT